MSWDWVGEYPIFVYTSFIDHFHFNVSIYKGEKNNQNGKETLLIKYEQFGKASKREVVKIALERAREILQVPKEEIGEEWDEGPEFMCPNCGSWENEKGEWATSDEEIKHRDFCDPKLCSEYKYDDSNIEDLFTYE
jgi:hypothetical protein